MTKIVGILNITPDSFSDGGQYDNRNKALEQAQKMLYEGADVIDIGAESSRPGAEVLNHDVEWQRLQNILPELVSLVHKAKKEVSLDSYHPETIAKALSCNIDYVNDVTAFADLRIVDLLKESNAKYILMHNLGLPVKKDVIIAKDKDVISVLRDWSIAKIDFLQKNGISKERIILDPGIGFGKDTEQSFEILQRIEELSDLDVGVYIGHSRKSLLKQLPWNISEKRDAETAYLSAQLAKKKNVQYLRVHNVQMNLSLINLAKQF